MMNLTGRLVKFVEVTQLTDLGFRLDSNTSARPRNFLNPLGGANPVTFHTVHFPEDLGFAVVKGNAVEHVKINLGRIYHGTHEKVLKNQNELDGALTKLWELLNNFSVRSGAVEIAYFTRIEIGWNFPVAFREVEPIVAACQHPWVRRGRITSPGESWSRKGDMFSIKVYDKGRMLVERGEVNSLLSGEPPACTRVEIILSKRKLREVFENLKIHGIPTFEQLRQVMHHALEQMQTSTIAVTKSRAHALARLVAHLKLEGTSISGMCPLHFAQIGMSKPRARSLARMVNGIVFEKTGFSLRTLYGEGKEWPEPFDSERSKPAVLGPLKGRPNDVTVDGPGRTGAQRTEDRGQSNDDVVAATV